MHIERVLCFTSFALTIAEVVMCLYGTFIVCFSIFLLVSTILVLEISKLLIKCLYGNLTPLKWLAISQQEDLFNQIWLSFNLSGEIYASTPSHKPHHFIRKKSQLRVVTKRMCEKVPSILPAEICDCWRKQLAAESERQSLSQGHSESFPESGVVSLTDEMFGHPLATLAVANEHLDAIGKHLSPVQTKAVERMV